MKLTIDITPETIEIADENGNSEKVSDKRLYQSCLKRIVGAVVFAASIENGLKSGRILANLSKFEN